MKKTLLAIALTTSVGAVNAVTEPMTSATFTMLDGTGGLVGLDTAVTGSIGDGAWAVTSTNTFFGQLWTAHGGTTFGPGTYSFDTIEGGIYTGVEVGTGQVGGHILFNWGVTADIDVVNVWDITESSIPDPARVIKTYTSTDVTATNPVGPDGIRGLSMIDGAFPDFNANFDFTFEAADDTPPDNFTLLGDNPLTILIDDPYVEARAECFDAAPQENEDTFIAIDSTDVNTSIGGIYTVTYDCTDTNLNAAEQITRTVVVAEPGPPLVALIGDDPTDQECAIPYVDDGAICADFEDGQILGTDDPLPGNLFSIDQVDLDAGLALLGAGLGPYTVMWSCRDSDLNTVNANRAVNIVDTAAPVITVIGDDPVNIVSSTVLHPVTYTDEGATAADACDTGAIGVTTDNPVDVNAPDTGDATLTYTVKYEASDTLLNKGEATRTVNVTRSQPVIILIDGNLILNIGDTYTELGMDITDAQDGNLTDITTSGTSTGVGAGERDLTYTIDSSTVDTSTQGDYSVTYNVTDFDGNTATQVTRTVQVGLFATGSNFTMLDAQGDVFGGTNDVNFDWDQTQINTSETDLNFNMTITSQEPFPFFGFAWIAHDVRVFEPGTYSFDSGCTVAEIQATGCPAGTAANSGPTISMTVPDGMQGAHILFDWNTTDNIDVVNVWEVGGVWDRHGDTGTKNKLYDGLAGDAPDPLTTWKLVSTDANGDLVNGSPMVDGPFQGFYASFNAGPGGTAPPPEPYTGTASDTKIGGGLLASMNVWGLFAGLLTLFGFRRFSKKQ